jgi:hypothetical protein
MRTDLAYVHQRDIEVVALKSRAADVMAQNEQVVAGTTTIAVTRHETGPATVLLVRISSKTAPVIDTAQLRKVLTGQSVKEARQLLDGYAQRGGWTYALSTTPSWGQRLPVAQGLINIDFVRSN